MHKICQGLQFVYFEPHFNHLHNQIQAANTSLIDRKNVFQNTFSIQNSNSGSYQTITQLFSRTIGIQVSTFDAIKALKDFPKRVSTSRLQLLPLHKFFNKLLSKGLRATTSTSRPTLPKLIEIWNFNCNPFHHINLSRLQYCT